jgi:hypothetical protein
VVIANDAETVVPMMLPAGPPRADRQRPLYARGWFWGVVGGAIAAGTVAALWAGGAFQGGLECREGFNCR